MINLIAISGSLRKVSCNRLLLTSCASIAPAGITITLTQLLADLPLFNPDIEGENYDLSAPDAVQQFRTQLNNSDGVIIASPEYAHGVTGVIKNALDWLVASGEMVLKPVMLLNASARAHLAYSALTETITVMNASICETACITVPVLDHHNNPHDLLAEPQIVTALECAISDFVLFIERQSAAHSIENS